MIEVWRLGRYPVNTAAVDEINQLLTQLRTDVERVTLLNLEKALQNPDRMIFVAYDIDGKSVKIVGLALIFFQWRFSGWLAEIHDVVVDRDCRGQGIGNLLTKGLIAAVHYFVDKHGQKVTVYLTSKPVRQAANEMYKKHGFELVAKSCGEKGTNLYKLVITP